MRVWLQPGCSWRQLLVQAKPEPPAGPAGSGERAGGEGPLPTPTPPSALLARWAHQRPGLRAPAQCPDRALRPDRLLRSHSGKGGGAETERHGVGGGGGGDCPAPRSPPGPQGSTAQGSLPPSTHPPHTHLAVPQVDLLAQEGQGEAAAFAQRAPLLLRGQGVGLPLKQQRVALGLRGGEWRAPRAQPRQPRAGREAASGRDGPPAPSGLLTRLHPSSPGSARGPAPQRPTCCSSRLRRSPVLECFRGPDTSVTTNWSLRREGRELKAEGQRVPLEDQACRSSSSSKEWGTRPKHGRRG